MKRIGLGLMVAVVCAGWAVGPSQLGGRIVGKQGVQGARVWTIEVKNGGPELARGVRVGSVRFTQTSLGGGAACTPRVTSPVSLPLVLGDMAAGEGRMGNVTVDFNGCANQAQFTVEMEFSDTSGAIRGTLKRSNDYR